LINGIIWTAEKETPYAEAILIENDIIIQVGTNQEINEQVQNFKDHVSIINLQGKFVIPGFIDPHIHFLMGGERLNSVDLREVNTKEEFINKIGEFTKTLNKGEWIRGGNWDHINWGGELPERSWIDSVTPDNPVWINRHEGHTYLANTLALKIAGLVDGNISLQEKEGDSFERTKEGSLTGVFKDNAMRFVYKLLPVPSFEENKKFLESAMDLVASHGITSIHHMTEPCDRNRGGVGQDYNFYREYVKTGKLKTRIYCAIPIELIENIDRDYNNDKMLRPNSIKGYVDGSIGSLSAAFSKDYLTKPGYNGEFVNTLDDLYNWIKEADDQNIQVFIHAIGDRAITTILDIFEKVMKVNGKKDRRWRIEHAQHILPKDIPRFKELGVIASMQPYHLVDDSRFIASNLDKELVRSSYVIKSLLDSGATVAFGSDWFVAPPDPIKTIDAAVNRIGQYGDVFIPDERISAEEALYCCTYVAAYSGFEEIVKGSIKKGKLADLAVLDRNILKIDPLQIKNTKVVMTILGGEIIYENKSNN
jgi:predicted amidohydrolase YtcJ